MAPAEVDAVFSRRLRELALKRATDVARLAREAGMPATRLQACLDGAESVELDELAALARVLRVEPAALIRDE